MDSEGPNQPAQSDQDLLCLLTESLDTKECMNGEQSPRRYFTHAHDDLNLLILPMFKGTFTLDIAHIQIRVTYLWYMLQYVHYMFLNINSGQTKPYNTGGMSWTRSVTDVGQISISK